MYLSLQNDFCLKIEFVKFYLSGAFEYWSWVCGAAWCSDNAYGILNESVAEESKEFIQPQNLVGHPGEEHSENLLNEGSIAVTLNDSTLTSEHVAPAAQVTDPLRFVT